MEEPGFGRRLPSKEAAKSSRVIQSLGRREGLGRDEGRRVVSNKMLRSETVISADHLFWSGIRSSHLWRSTCREQACKGS